MNQVEDAVAATMLPEAVTRGGWQLAAAQVRGPGHEARGQECQDFYRVTMARPDELIIAIADGAGSAKLAEIGATVATHQASEQLCTLLSQSNSCPTEMALKAMLQSAIVAARDALEAEATLRKISSSELATTLILIVARQDFVAVGHVGDGATVIADQAGNLIGLTTPPVSDYVNETFFLTSAEPLRHMQLVVWHGRARHLAAFSDGLQWLGLRWPDRVPHQPFFRPLFDFVDNAPNQGQAGPELESFLISDKIKSRTDDDLTLILAANIGCDDEG
jgi:hypothetical protein